MRCTGFFSTPPSPCGETTTNKTLPPTPYSLLPTPYSLLPTPYSLLPKTNVSGKIEP
ncbi:MAG: hypothetical protein F6K50_32865 [Moorea sp. SIO3I7]|uniref:hypothetical protein n=1 Tax=unclassified Moorena TaxID=2683338 RepID=UPI0013BFC140|nr:MULTISPECIES: hypothetical protein [unclassified Moorena]NEO00089.1 hypothetical protein [Moorena sp. SIO3I7]NEO05969.1 hypothetical protein [Moorena sp. SIO3I8]NEP26831.1 hypothetical protein [Moorena sp. SIO3I6]